MLEFLPLTYFFYSMHNSTKVTPRIRREIYTRWKEGTPQKQLGTEYRVHRNTISKICLRWAIWDFSVHRSTRSDYRTFTYNIRKLDLLSAHLKKEADRKAGIIRYEKEYAGELGHIDVHKIKNIKWENPKKKKYLATLVDDATRISYSQILPNKKAQTLALFLRDATVWFKQKWIIFKAILTDNGREFTTHTDVSRPHHTFEKMMKKLGITHKYTRVRRPQTNWKVERWWRIFEEQFFQIHQFTSWKDFNMKFMDWLYHYNYKRPHWWLQYMTPMGKYELTLKKPYKYL